MLTLPPNSILQPNIKVIKPDGFTAPHVFRDEVTMDSRELKTLFRRQTAAEFVGTLKPSSHLFGVTKGQFSLVDVIREVTAQTGPVDFMLSTWTVAKADLGELQEFLSDGRFKSLKMLLDFSFQRRQPALIAQVRKLFGDESIVVTRNHCKLFLASNDAWKIVCRTSMNLNFNPRLEDVEIKNDPALFAFLAAIVNDIFRHHKPKQQIGKTYGSLAGEFAGLESASA